MSLLASTDELSPNFKTDIALPPYPTRLVNPIRNDLGFFFSLPVLRITPQQSSRSSGKPLEKMLTLGGKSNVQLNPTLLRGAPPPRSPLHGLRTPGGWPVLRAPIARSAPSRDALSAPSHGARGIAAPFPAQV